MLRRRSPCCGERPRPPNPFRGPKVMLRVNAAGRWAIDCLCRGVNLGRSWKGALPGWLDMSMLAR